MGETNIVTATIMPAAGATIDRLAPEFQLLCRATGKPGKLVLPLCGTPVDWDALVKGAWRHRVAPLVLRALDPRDIPTVPRAALRHRVAADARRCLAWLVETDRLRRSLEESGIHALVLKGCALSLQLYGDPSTRQCGDIDLLVDPARLWEADAVLLSQGYKRKHLRDDERTLHEHWIKDLSYQHPDSRWVVELHHRLTSNPHLLPLDFDRMWRERETITANTLSFPTLPRGWLSLYLCVHGATHDWERLRWLADLATLLRPPAEQALLADLADAQKLLPLVRHATQLAHDWLGLPLHDSRLKIGPRDIRRLRRFAARYGTGSTSGLLPSSGYDWDPRMALRLRLNSYRLRPEIRYRLRQAAGELFSRLDWAAFPLPRRWHWLYPLLSPLGWIVRRTTRPGKHR